jgi:hypothetical protein
LELGAAEVAEAADRLGARRLWIRALSEGSSLVRELGAVLERVRRWELWGLSARVAFEDYSVALGLQAGWLEREPQGWLLAPPERLSLERAFARGLDLRLGAALREPSGSAASAPWPLRPNPISCAVRRARLSPKAPAEWKGDISWERQLGWALDTGLSPSLADALRGRAKTMAHLGSLAMEAARNVQLIASGAIRKL